ncbi:hypothetical protein N184_23305 [Sinorhizobium sp. GL28]|nr:hypothetical protein N184_23305 [Sinorhizobium sp. GL28]
MAVLTPPRITMANAICPHELSSRLAAITRPKTKPSIERTANAFHIANHPRFTLVLSWVVTGGLSIVQRDACHNEIRRV